MQTLQPSGEAARTCAARRSFLTQSVALATVLLLDRAYATGETLAGELTTIEHFSATGASLGTAQVPRLAKTQREWLAQLSEPEFEVTRRGGTEMPYSGQYLKHSADGLYRCVCCATALFDSKTKYDSRTGWPSFWQPISAQNLIESVDYSARMQRVGVWCRLCEAHLGHVFADGPKPSGLRYCMNSAALKFVPRSCGKDGCATDLQAAAPGVRAE